MVSILFSFKTIPIQLQMRGSKPAPTHAVMADKANGISIVDKRIFARDSLIDGDQHFFLA